MSIFEPIKTLIGKIGLFFSRLFEKDVVVKITSLAAAIVIWFVISVSVYPEIDRVIYNVPVDISLEGTYAEANGFKAMSSSDEYVTVYLKGQRGDVGNLKAEDLVAVASAENVLSSAEYSLPLTVEGPEGTAFEVTRIEPASVSVDFDKIVTKEVPVTPNIAEISAAEGYVIDSGNVVAVPQSVNITGPEEIVDSISLAAIRIDGSTSLTDTREFKADSLKLYNGISVLEDEKAGMLSYDKSEFTVKIPVYAKMKVGLNVRITNAPDSFDTEKFKQRLELSVSELEVAVPNEIARDNSIPLDIGAIDMREVDIGKEFTFDVNSFLPDGYLDWNGIEKITVKCPSEGLKKKAVHITTIEIVNAPAQYDFKIITSGVTPTVVGPEDVIDRLTYIDVTAKIDMLNVLDFAEGNQKLPVTFSIPAYSDVWSIGSDGSLSPWATIQVSAKSE